MSWEYKDRVIIACQAERARRMRRRDNWRLAGAIAVILLVVACLAGYGAFWWHQRAECLAHGGSWRVVGYSVYASKKSVSVTPDYGCVMPARR